jgi:hypothetical protein
MLIGNEALIDTTQGIHKVLQDALGLHQDLGKLLQRMPTAELLSVMHHNLNEMSAITSNRLAMIEMTQPLRSA